MVLNCTKKWKVINLSTILSKFADSKISSVKYLLFFSDLLNFQTGTSFLSNWSLRCFKLHIFILLLFLFVGIMFRCFGSYLFKFQLSSCLQLGHGDYSSLVCMVNTLSCLWHLTYLSAIK